MPTMVQATFGEDFTASSSPSGACILRCNLDHIPGLRRGISHIRHTYHTSPAVPQPCHACHPQHARYTSQGQGPTTGALSIACHVYLQCIWHRCVLVPCMLSVPCACRSVHCVAISARGRLVAVPRGTPFPIRAQRCNLCTGLHHPTIQNLRSMVLPCNILGYMTRVARVPCEGPA